MLSNNSAKSNAKVVLSSSLARKPKETSRTIRDVNSGEVQIAFLKLKTFWRHFLLIVITLIEPPTCTQCQVFVEKKKANLVF